MIIPQFTGFDNFSGALLLTFSRRLCYTFFMKQLLVEQFAPHDVEADVPASKSILNRALLLAALAKGDVHLECGAFSEDTRALLSCLQSLGIEVQRKKDGVTVAGCGGEFPEKNAFLNVMSAGTAARFLPVVLAFAGGDYRFESSDQMKGRPMDVLFELERLGVAIEYLEERGHFPFRLVSEGISSDEAVIDTDKSTQFASGLLIASTIHSRPFTLSLMGGRTRSSYLKMTEAMLRSFGAACEREGDRITVSAPAASPARYAVEPDLSGACYLYALALIFSVRVLVRGVKKNSLQGDAAFLRLLERRGVVFCETERGLLADGTAVKGFDGFEENLQDFSDQALTVAALAPFARTPSRLTGLEHIRAQECDRVNAIVENLNTLGVPASYREGALSISPAPVRSGMVKTFHDHRVAMAFSLIGLKTGNVTIDDPDCTRKTFEGYFELLSRL